MNGVPAVGDVIEAAGVEYVVDVVEPQTDYSYFVEAWGNHGAAYLTLTIEVDERTV